MDLKQFDINNFDMMHQEEVITILLGGAKWRKKLSGKFPKNCTVN